MEILTTEQKTTLAREMYDYISGVNHSRTQVLEGFAEKFKTTEAYAKELLKGRRNLQEIQADWLIDQIWGMMSVRKIREVFQVLFGGSPERFGYQVPSYQPDDIAPTEKTLFERWQQKELLKP